MVEDKTIRIPLKSLGLVVNIDPTLSGKVQINLEGKIGITVTGIDTRDVNYPASPKGAVYELMAFRENSKGEIEQIPGAIYLDDDGMFLASNRCVIVNPEKRRGY